MRLASEPDWHAATGELVSGFAELATPDERIRLMDRLCERLGGSLYPAFLQMLCIVERNGTPEARALVVDTLLHALGTDRLPVGRMPAWGAPRAMDGTSFETGRPLGPIEFLCAWYAQPSELAPLERRAFGDVGVRLIRLFSADERVRAIYCERLLERAHGSLDGALARETRGALAAFATEWRRSDDPDAPLEACLAALAEAGGERLGQIESNPFL